MVRGLLFLLPVAALLAGCGASTTITATGAAHAVVGDGTQAGASVGLANAASPGEKVDGGR